MDDKLIIKCPNCSKRLTLKVVPGIERKSLTCPACRQASPFSSFTVLEQKSPTPSAKSGEATRMDDLGHTHIQLGGIGAPANTNATPGRFVAVDASLAPMQLKEGRNILGRESSSAPVDIALPTQYKSISRQHLIIDVRRTAVGYVHTVMLCKSEVNRTYINAMQLAYGDQVILNDGDIVKLPNLSLRFEQSSRKELYDSDVVTGGRS